MAQDKGKPKFIRKNGKIIPIGVNKDKKKIKSGDYKGVTRGRKKEITKVLNEEKGYFKKRNKVIHKRQRFGTEIGVAAGLGIQAMKGGSLLKGALVGGLAGLLGGTLSGKSKADKKYGARFDHYMKKKNKNSQGF